MKKLRSLSRTLRGLLGIGAYNPAVLDSMRRSWDERAKQNARHYVATSQEVWNDEDFFRSGSAGVQDLVLSDLTAICDGRNPTAMRALEIGCGAGRMTLPLSKIFGRVDAVDISAEMITQARSALQGCSNVGLHLNNGADLSIFQDAQFDFAISALVFQHIPKRIVVENYIQDTWRVLRPGSLFKFQLQGYPISEEQADTWVGAGFTEEQMRDVAERTGFRMKESRGAGTQYYWLTFVKPRREPVDGDRQ